MCGAKELRYAAAHVTPEGAEGANPKDYKKRLVSSSVPQFVKLIRSISAFVAFRQSEESLHKKRKASS